MKKLPTDLKIVVILILVCLCLVLWRVLPGKPATGDPAVVVKHFIKATDSGDVRAVQLCLSKASLAATMRASGDKVEAVTPIDQRKLNEFALKVVSNNGRTARVIMKPISGLAHNAKSRYYIKGAFKSGVPYVVINENGVWKLDMIATEKLWFATSPTQQN